MDINGNQKMFAMMNFMKQHNFILSANFHEGAELVNYPWDTWNYLHADDEWFNNISRQYADTVHFWSAPYYTDYFTDENNGITNGYAWYQAIGSRQDYVTYFLHAGR